MIRSIYLSTNGCEEAGLSSSYVEELGRRSGATITRDPARADLVVFFACGLTDEKERESLSMARRIQAAMCPSARLVLWGCLAKINPEALAGVQCNGSVGPLDTAFFQDLFPDTAHRIDEISANRLAPSETRGLYEAHPAHLVPRLRLRRRLIDLWHRWILREEEEKDPIFYVRVATGCLSHCTFCSERVAWGRNVSRAPGTVLSEIDEGLRRGYRRFLLLAGDLGVYGTDLGSSLPELLDRIVRTHREADLRLILSQLNPRYLKDLFPGLEPIFASGRVEMLGCPAQSGSDRILRRMGRRYTSAEWRHYMLLMNERYPEVHLKPQFMVGFPGETEEDFRQTLALLDYPLFLHDIKIFRFANRPTIPAARMDGHVSDEVKEERYRRLARRYARRYALHLLRGRPGQGTTRTGS